MVYDFMPMRRHNRARRDADLRHGREVGQGPCSGVGTYISGLQLIDGYAKLTVYCASQSIEKVANVIFL